jgi:predicted NBD/HSP70 family sugar kinase
MVDEVLSEITDVRGKIGHDITIIGLGLAVAGLVASQSGVVHVAPNLGWHDEPFGEQLHQALAGTELEATPIVVDNEANFGALAEHARGRADGVDDFVYVLAEHGVGGGVVSGGRLISGANGYAGEVGHMTLVRGGDRCGCGSRGCWETLIGLQAMLRAAVPDVAEAVIADDLLSPEDKVGAVVERARRGDRIAVTALDELGEWFGVGVSNLVDVFNPRLVVIAGALAEVAEWIVPPAMRVLGRGTVAENAAGCIIATSSLGHRAASLGAALRCVQRVHADPPSVRPAVA